MNPLAFGSRDSTVFHMADHGGDSVKGGGHPADETVPAEEEIRDALGEMTPQRGRMPGTNDPGVPGSRTQTGQGKPMEDESARSHPHPGPQSGEGGTGSGGSDKGGETDKRKR
jgi:hypothetical protein